MRNLFLFWQHSNPSYMLLNPRISNKAGEKHTFFFSLEKQIISYVMAFTDYTFH